jgi:hypothetical protein
LNGVLDSWDPRSPVDFKDDGKTKVKQTIWLLFCHHFNAPPSR